ncbi:retrovirus-related pol polyprotein from transposon TNT 1-94 [Tanacetum coccineum]
MDDLYNNLKVYKPEVKGMSSSSSSTQNMDFVNAAYSTNIDNLSDDVIYAFFSSQPNSPQLVHEDLQQIYPYDIEEIDLRWQMAMLTMRARRLSLACPWIQQQFKRLTYSRISGSMLIFNSLKHFVAYYALPRLLVPRAPRNQDNKNKESLRRSVPVEISTSTSLVSCDGLDGYDWSDQAEEGPNYALMAYSEVNFIPPTPTCLITGFNDFCYGPLVENSKVMSSKEEPKVVRKNDDAPYIEEWVSDDEEEDVSQPKTEKKTVRPRKSCKRLPSKLFEKESTSVACKKEINTEPPVAERRNRTLIKAARTMLADSKLPTTFWAEAVNTACYVQNRVLVVKPHNKTPYELFHGRTPTLSFMRPFWCTVTILNTIDHLGKFDGKADEGFFVGYSLNSGLDWLFDIGIKASDTTGHSRKETEPVKDYILLPLWTADPPYSQDPKSSHDDGSKPSSDIGKKVDEDLEIKLNVMIREGRYCNTALTMLMLRTDTEKLLQFKLQEVWTLVDLPNEKRAIGSKWGFKNKKDEKRIMIRNKVRLVAQGYTQEEGIDYDEVFAPVARMQ